MAKPTEIPTWSTDANFPAGTDPWSGTPTRVEPDPGDKAAGFVPATRGPAQWFNYLFGFVTDWIVWLDATFATAIREVRLDLYGVTRPRNNTWALQFSSADYERWLSAVDAGGIDIGVPPLPFGSTITGVVVRVVLGAARVGTNRLGVKLYSFSSTGVTTTEIPITYSSTSAGIDTVICTPGSPIAVNESTLYYVRVISGTDGVHVPDALDVIRVFTTDPSPRAA
jgi:hypothetical protein